MQPSPAALQRYQEARGLMSRHLVFFSTLLMWAEVRWSTEYPIAATDGTHLWLHPEGFGELSREQMVGVLCHEVLHMALNHVSRRGKRDITLWNIACDISVNGMIREQMEYTPGLSLPKGLVIVSSLEGYSPEEIYEVLQQNQDESLPRQTGIWDLAKNPARQKEKQPLWKEALRQALQRSQHPRIQERIAVAEKGTMDWRKALWEFLTPIGGDYGGFDRRFVGEGLYLDGLESHFTLAPLNLQICVDTSGSVDEDALGRFLGEIKRIVETFPQVEPVLWAADSEIYGPMNLSNFKLMGGGGTDFIPFFKKLKPEDLAIYLTDGYGTFPSKSHPQTLWVVTPLGLDNAKFPFGKVVRLVD